MNQAHLSGCDLLVISPHTDDLEIGLGGTVAMLAGKDRRVWALDLTRGELGSNATPDERWEEAAAASAILGLSGRVQLELPDGFINPQDAGQAAQVAVVVRRLRPRWVITAPDPVRHPDHIATPLLVGRACHLARMANWRPKGGPGRIWPAGGDLPPAAERWETEAVFGVCSDGDRPTFVFDVSATWDRKLEAMACYKSQFERDDRRLPTAINDPGFLDKIERRGKTWGQRAGVEYGEAIAGSAAGVVTDLPDQEWR